MYLAPDGRRVACLGGVPSQAIGVVDEVRERTSMEQAPLLTSHRPDESESRGVKPRLSDARFAGEARAEDRDDREIREGGRKPPPTR